MVYYINIYKHKWHNVAEVLHTDRWVYESEEEARKASEGAKDYIKTITFELD